MGWLEFNDRHLRPIVSALPNYLPRSYEKSRDVRDISQYLIYRRNRPVVKRNASETRAVICAEHCFRTGSSVFVYQTSLKYLVISDGSDCGKQRVDRSASK